jgi:hypothetical protein
MSVVRRREEINVRFHLFNNNNARRFILRLKTYSTTTKRPPLHDSTVPNNGSLEAVLEMISLFSLRKRVVIHFISILSKRFKQCLYHDPFVVSFHGRDGSICDFG